MVWSGMMLYDIQCFLMIVILIKLYLYAKCNLVHIDRYIYIYILILIYALKFNIIYRNMKMICYNLIFHIICQIFKFNKILLIYVM